MNDAIDTFEKMPNLRNPFSKVKLETPEVREAIVVTPEDAMAAIRSLQLPEDQAFLALFFLAGLRLSEHMAVTSSQIDFEKGVIVIDRAVKLGPTGRQEVGLPKGDKKRLVALCPTLAELLKPVIEKTGSYIFPASSVDRPRMKKLVYANWRRILTESGLPGELEPRDCRLSHNTWIEKFCPRVSISTRLEHMGHSVNRNNSEHRGLTVNLRNYTRFMTEGLRVLRADLEDLVTGIRTAKFDRLTLQATQQPQLYGTANMSQSLEQGVDLGGGTRSS
jgi:integrase